MPIRHAIIAAAALAACDAHDHAHDHRHPEVSSGATCPEGSALTWETFGKAFMVEHCAPCHAAGLVGAERQGAPAGHDLDTLGGALAMGAWHLDAVAGAGSLATNTAMPPASFPSQPSLEARRQLAEWLACGLP